MDWIREFTSKIKTIISTGIELQLVYVGKRKLGRSISDILAAIAQEKLSGYLSLYNIRFFWLRLEHIRRSKLQTGMLCDEDRILKELESMMSYDDNGWALFGKGDSPETVQYQGTELMDCLDRFPLWAPNIGKVGFLGSIASAFSPPSLKKLCSQHNVILYVEDSVEGIVICEECKCPMERFVLYQCLGTQ